MQAYAAFDADEQENKIVEEGWHISDDGEADWALRKVKEERSKRDRLTVHFQRQIVIAQEKCAREEERFSTALMEYFATLPARETKTQKAYDLPSGKLVLKHREPEYKPDDKVLTRWLLGNGMVEMVKTEQTASWAALKPLVHISGENVVYTETGEIVDGVKVVERGDEFRMEV